MEAAATAATAAATAAAVTPRRAPLNSEETAARRLVGRFEFVCCLGAVGLGCAQIHIFPTTFSL